MKAIGIFHCRNLFHLLDKSCIGLSIIFLSFLVYVFFIQKQEAWSSPVTESQIVTGEDNSMKEVIVPDKPYEYYEAQFKRRDIFGLASSETADDTAKIAGFNQLLKVVGTVLANPAEAIIEDIQTKETFFLNPGDMLREARVQTISEGEVIFLYNGKTIHLMQPE